MTELKVAGLVDLFNYHKEEDKRNVPNQIILKDKFKWFLTDEFAELKDKNRCNKKYPPHTDGNKKTGPEREQPADNSHDKEHESNESDAVRGGEILLHPPTNEIIQGEPEVTVTESGPSPTKSSIYRIGNTDRFGCNCCKQKGDKWFMQEHNCKGKGNGQGKGKVDSIVKANLSGEGVMDYS